MAIVKLTKNNIEYSGTNLSSLFSQRKNLLNLNFWRMLYEAVTFNLLAKKHIKKYQNYTIQEYLDLKNYSDFYLKLLKNFDTEVN